VLQTAILAVVAMVLYRQLERTQDAPESSMITVLYQHQEKKQFYYKF